MTVSGSYVSTRERARSSISGVIPGVIGLAFLLPSWMPTTAVVVWLGLYLLISVMGIALTLKQYVGHMVAWTVAVGGLFGLLPISAVVWGDSDTSFWIAITVVALFIAGELAALPLLQTNEWRYGIATSGLMMTIAAMFVLPVPIALLVIPLIGNLLVSADKMRKLRDTLQRERTVAQAETTRAREIASHDELTALLNRRGLREHMESFEDRPWTVVLIDVNRFKWVNDTYGYAAGDQILTRMAAELNQRLSDDWIIGRHGGDEFVAIAEGRMPIAAKVCNPVACDLTLYGAENRISVTLAAGITYADGSIPVDRALSEAGYALQSSKRTGTTISRFGGDLKVRFEQMLEVSAGAAGPESIRVFEAEAQTICAEDGTITGLELLARWRRSDGTLVPPDDFLPLLAENGLMPVLNDAMLEKGVAFAARFNNRPRAPFVSVNIGASSLASPVLVDLVGSLLAEYRVDPARLMIEITESEVLDDSTLWEASARKLEAMGVKLAIDDFGSGYSSIERMNQLPISHLKFDRSLTTSITGPLGEIMRGVVRFAELSGLGVIAEGIETFDAVESMQAIGIRQFQGWWFGRPISLDEAERKVISQFADADLGVGRGTA